MVSRWIPGFGMCVALLVAAPALAGERTAYRPAADAMALLMDDQRTTFGTEPYGTSPPPTIVEVRDFDLRWLDAVQEIQPDRGLNLADFETLKAAPVAGSAEIVVTGRRMDTPASDRDGFAALREATAFGARIESGWGGRYAVTDSMNRQFALRPPRVLDARLVFRLDGDHSSPALSVGGGIGAALWQAMPKP